MELLLLHWNRVALRWLLSQETACHSGSSVWRTLISWHYDSREKESVGGQSRCSPFDYTPRSDYILSWRMYFVRVRRVNFPDETQRIHASRNAISNLPAYVPFIVYLLLRNIPEGLESVGWFEVNMDYKWFGVKSRRDFNFNLNIKMEVLSFCYTAK